MVESVLRVLKAPQGMAVRQDCDRIVKLTDCISNFLYNKATILPQRGGDREDKELLPRSILEIIRRKEVCKVWQ